ncbi:aminotransferase class I/II-fold pyridoxal phosphate-dependent enzyme [Feifania hominis]|uniref:Methionine gamma-lyase family protein n=1 Tax=Feifania hominis TaxID=2763660 RepID=A0A926DCN3_9FIRM|nr:methionine gamma-lyase family protein [Feifania hominis]MBC8535663.1 methionine gamma-lyase family protein [Feifania hominis]
MTQLFRPFSFSQELIERAQLAEQRAQQALCGIGQTAAYNSRKVLHAFMQQGVSERHFLGTTGYGYDDSGRDTLDRVYAQVFGAEDAMVRHFMLSGTHALTVALFGVLRPGDVMVSVAGKPYDTLDGVIGLNGVKNGSLADFGVHYEQVDLLEDGTLDFDGITEAARRAPRMIYLQRSRGYERRPSISVAEIETVCKIVHRLSDRTIVMVDNCYGEFVETREPTEVGADLMAGSLIKNPGGSMAESGGYIAGRADLVELCAYRLTSPGLGKEVGASLNQNRNLYRGFFFAPHITGEALKTAVFAAALFEELGFACSPRYCEPRTDIVEQIVLGSPAGLKAFCEGIQAGSPIDSFVVPQEWDMPGYQDQVIMAAGAFVQGSSIELSADGPMRAPYIAFMQGGIVYDTAQIGVLMAAQRLADEGLVTL